jgi:hypothetical protein
VMDAYEMSVPGLARYLQTNDPSMLQLRPVVRIQTSVFDLSAMLLQLEGMVPAVRERLIESKLFSPRDIGVEEDSAGASHS